MKKSGNKLIVVLGMHRSGTSVITRGLQVMGVELGTRLMPPVEGNNEKGFWEDMDLNSLNIEMLNFLNSEWHFLTPIQPSDLDLLKENGYLLRAAKMLHGKTSGIPIFGFKDPRTAKLLPFWKEAFAQSRLNVSYVLTIRHPLSVYKSLARRDGFDSEKSHLLWLAHVLGSLIGTAGESRVLVDYDHLMQAPEAELTRIAKGLQLQIDIPKLEDFKTGFLDEELRHTVYQLNDLMLDEVVPPLAREVYSEVLNVFMDNTQLESETFKNKIAQWNNEFSRQKSALVLADKLTSRMFILDQTLREGNIQIAHLNRVVGEKEQALAEGNRQIAHLNQVVGEKEQALAEGNRQIAHLNQAVVEREQTVQAFSSQVLEHKHELAEIRNSRTWKIALLFRQLRVIVAPPNSFRTRVLRLLFKIIVYPFKEVNQNQETDSDLLRTSDLFDADWYLANNPDVALARVDPVNHYLISGGLEGRNPHILFNTSFYLLNNPDVATSGMNPLVHYLRYGGLEGRDPNPNFNVSQYLERNPEIKETGLNPLIHYLLKSQENENALTANEDKDDFWLDEDTLELISDLTR